MSNRLAEIQQRIGTDRQLGSVVNAMRGIAGARSQQARLLLPALRVYAETARRAIAQARALEARGTSRPAECVGRSVLVLFGAEEGFAGAFADRGIEAAAEDFLKMSVILVGSRSAALAAERGYPVLREIALPGRASAIPDLATGILEAVQDHACAVGAAPLAVLYPVWRPGHGIAMLRRQLLPVDLGQMPGTRAATPPITNLPPGELVASLVEEYVFAQLCEAAAEGFAAENEARMTMMASAKTNVDQRLVALEAEQRLTRQDEITAEVVELAAGARSRTRADREPSETRSPIDRG